MPKNKKAKKEKKAPQRALIKKSKKEKKKKKVASSFTIDNRVPKGTRKTSAPPPGEYVAYNARTGERVVMGGATSTFRHPLYQAPGTQKYLNPVEFVKRAAFTLPQHMARAHKDASSSFDS